MEEIMFEKEIDLPKINPTSTKKEMLDAFNELKKKLSEKSETELKPEKKKEEMRAVEVIKVADSLTPEGAVSKITELKTEIGKMLSQLSDKLEEETSNYLKIKEGIELKKTELKEIYDIENSAFTLAALIETQREKKQEFEEEISTKKNVLEDEIKQMKILWDKEKKDHDQAIKERDVEEKKTRERLKEEFEYNFKREQQLSLNTFNDQKSKMEKELAAAKDEFEKKSEETDKSLNEREEKITEREKLMDDLQKQVEKFPGQLESSVNKAVKEVTDRLTETAKKNEELLKKEYEGEKNVLKTKIESLERMVAEQSKQVTELSAQLEKSYGKVQDIAVKAIEGSSASHRMSAIEQHFLEKKINPPQDSKS
jgi:hypothetical protein